MASKAGIARVFELWRRAGRVRPAGWSTGRGPEADAAEVEAVVDAWVTLLGDVTDADLARAAVEVARSGGEWWPTVPQVLDAVRQRPMGLTGPEVWGLVKPRLNSYRTAEQALADVIPPAHLPAVLCAIDSVGGWGALCASPEKEEPHTQRRLGEAYTVAAARTAYVAETETAGRLLELRRGVGRLSVVEGERPGLAAWARGGGGE